MQPVGEDRERRRQPEISHDPHLVWRVGDEVSEEAQHLASLGHGPHQQTGEHGRAERVKLVFEGCDDAEVAAAAAQRPEQFGMFIVTCHQKLAVGGDDVAGQEVVDGEPESAHQVANPAAQRQSTDARVRDDASGHRESEGLTLVVEVAPQATALSPGRSCQRVNPYAGHVGQVDHQAVVTHRMPGHRMCPATDRDRKAFTPCEAYSGHDICRARTPHDDCGIPVDRVVPDLARAVVVRIARHEHCPGNC